MNPNRKKPKMKDVHFVFSSHSDGQKYHQGHDISRETKTFLMESFKGDSAKTVLERLKKKATTSRSRSRIAFLERAYVRGVNVIVGEQPTNVREKKKLNQLLSKEDSVKKVFGSNKNLKNYILYMRAFANTIKFRNELIRQKVHSLKRDGNMELEYGATHSTLRWNLRKEGIESTAEMNQRLFSHYSRVLRMLEMGKKPSMNDFRKAMLSHVLIKELQSKKNAKKLFGVNELSDKQYRFLTLFTSALIDNLSVKQLKMVSEPLSLKKLFEINGFKSLWELKIAERKEYLVQVKRFLERHSVFYRSIILSGKNI